MNYLNLIRWKNLLIMGLAQILIKYALFIPLKIEYTLNWFGFSLLVLSTLCIASAGNIINDIYDVETDLVNRPDKVLVGRAISERKATNLFIIFNVIGVLIGFYLSHLVGRSSFFALFVIISALLYVYASYLKTTLLIGNIVVSILVALSLIIVPVFELLPAITPQNQIAQINMFKVVFYYATFAFIINLIREMIKDIQDIDGDHKSGMNTLPIIIGRERSRNIIFVLSFVPVLLLIYFLSKYLYNKTIAVLYFLLFVVGPLIFTTIKIFNAKTKKDFQLISNTLKLIMLFGILSMLLYPIIIK
ncbi:MAG: geranylgeranylglycerol-phosphate geranylgeranyltransferase [Flavobacteriaceae bacterium]|nr:geranylgeranylglycerol-phosphate geranylgeranyltransferase [Flavobacteriaceae bacterium]